MGVTIVIIQCALQQPWSLAMGLEIWIAAVLLLGTAVEKYQGKLTIQKTL